MNKLRLDIDDLQVSSFVSIEPVPGDGTVHAHITPMCSANCDSENLTCGSPTCGEATCRDADYSCALSCTDCGTYDCPSGESCNRTCWHTGCAPWSFTDDISRTMRMIRSRCLLKPLQMLEPAVAIGAVEIRGVISREGCAPAGPRARSGRARQYRAPVRRGLGAVGNGRIVAYGARSPTRSAAEGHAHLRSSSCLVPAMPGQVRLAPPPKPYGRLNCAFIGRSSRALVGGCGRRRCGRGIR